MSSGRERLKDFVFLEIAGRLSTLGTCDRGKVGAIIVRDGRCVSWGYNGAPAGMPHCSENQHGYLNSKEDWGKSLELVLADHGCRNAIHAEANALAFAAKQGISTEGATLYCECAPCLKCAQLLIQAGIWRVVYQRPYRDDEGLDLLTIAQVDVDQV